MMNALSSSDGDQSDSTPSTSGNTLPSSPAGSNAAKTGTANAAKVDRREGRTFGAPATARASLRTFQNQQCRCCKQTFDLVLVPQQMDDCIRLAFDFLQQFALRPDVMHMTVHTVPDCFSSCNVQGIANTGPLYKASAVQVHATLHSFLLPTVARAAGAQDQKSSRDGLVLGVQIKGGKMVAKIFVDRSTWLPYGLQQPTPGSMDLWKYKQYSTDSETRIVQPTQVRGAGSRGSTGGALGCMIHCHHARLHISLQQLHAAITSTGFLVEAGL